jgi:glycosyltransferase involved in cell wall biosynthesis
MRMNFKPRVGIFVPCYNEEKNIEATLATLKKYSQERQHWQVVIIVVDDGSTDSTWEIVAKEKTIDALYRIPVNSGLGEATRVGMEIAYFLDCDAFVKFDADSQHVVYDADEPIQLLVADKADVVYASRFKGKIHYRMPLYRKVGNLVFTRLMKLITKWEITDSQTGMMCFGRRYLEVFEMPSSYNPPQQALFDASRKGMRYVETTAQFHPRKSGVSFISPLYIPKVLSSLLKLTFYFHSYRILLTYSLLSGALGSTIFLMDLIAYLNGGQVSYLQNGTTVLLCLSTSISALLLGLQGYATLSRNTWIRNGRLRYISAKSIVYVSGRFYKDKN